MKLYKFLIFVFFSLLLFSCKTKLVVMNISFSHIMSDTPTEEEVGLFIDVTSCDTHKNKTRASMRSLAELQKSVPAIFDKAKYIECWDDIRGHGAIAVFKMPIMVGGYSDDTTNIQLIHSKDKKEIILLLPKQIRENINQIERESSLLSTVSIPIYNQSDKNVKLMLINSTVGDAIDDKQSLYKHATVYPYEELKLKLSDLNMAYLLKTGQLTIAMDVK